MAELQRCDGRLHEPGDSGSQKTGEKTRRRGCLSEQLHQIETKLNLKPRATRATERL